jgi:hypothetical protein
MPDRETTTMADQSDRSATEQKVSNEFQAIEAAAPPGILDLIQVCGDYAAATQQATAYFSLLAPTVFSVSSNSSGQ